MKLKIIVLLMLFAVGSFGQQTNTIQLGDLDLSMIETERGNSQKNKTIRGDTIKIAGIVYEKGVGTAAPSKFLIDLNSKGKTFKAEVGACEMRFPRNMPGLPPGGPGGPGTPTEGTAGPPRRMPRMAMEFYVIADKEIIWQSGEMTSDDAAKKVDVDISGYQKLGLLVLNTGVNFMFGGMSAWANASIDYVGNKAPKAISNQLESTSKKIILTPDESPMPQINYPKIVGATPGTPFLFTIPVSGKRPMQITAENLPEGLSLDTITGIISGITPSSKKTYKVKITAKNRHGSAHDELLIKVGDLVALTPPMGWNSWNAFGLNVNQDKVKTAANAMYDKLRNHGWSYINIDDGWEAAERTPEGVLLPNEKFPDMKILSDYVHSRGLKLGIYSSPGERTCGQFLGSYGHEELDAKTWAEWGIDYLKYDWCSYMRIAKDNSLEELQKPYKIMRNALNKTGRDIVFSLCQYGMGNVSEWGADVGGNLWRTTFDIEDSWKSLLKTGFTQTDNFKFSEPGHWNDPDMLVVGNVGWNEDTKPSRLTPDEQYAHIGLWALLSAPMLIGCDMANLDDFTLNLLTNDEVIAINQDPLGKQAQQIINKDGYQIWAKKIVDGSIAVGLFFTGSITHNPIEMFNWGDEVISSKNISVTWEDLGIKGTQTVRNVWEQEDIGVFESLFDIEVNFHGVALLKFTQK